MNEHNKSNAELIAELVKLRQDNQRGDQIQNLMEGMPVGCALCEIILDKQGNPIDYRFIFTNSGFEKQTGLKIPFIGKTVKEIFPDIEQSWIEKYGSVAINRKPIQFTEFNHNTNKQYQVNAYSPAKYLFAVLFQDISEKLEIEEKIKTSEKRFRALFEQAGDYCMILDPHTEDGIPVIVDANEAAYKKHGYTREEFIGRPVVDIDDDEGKQLVVERTQAIMRGELRFLENTHLRRDGTTFPVAIHANRIDIEGEPSLIFTTEYDITKRKQAEEALIKSEERFRAITANTPDHIFFHDRELRYVMVINPQLGLTEEDILGKTDYDLLSKEEADTLVKAKKQVLESGKSMHFSTSLFSTTGHQEFFEGTYMPTLDTQNQPNGLVGYFRNVTESKRAKDETIKQKNLANNYLNIVGSIIIALNLEGEIILLNKKGHEILGYEEGELNGKDWFSTCLPKETALEIKMVFEQLMTGERGNLETHENEIIRKDGQKRIVKWFNSLVRDDLGNTTGILSSGEDITEAREKEELLITSEADLKKAQQVAKLGSWRWYIPENRLVWSDEMYRIFGIEQQEFTGDLADVMEKAIHPDDRATVEQANLSVINEGKPIPLEYRVIIPEGNTKTVWAEAGEMIVDQAGNPYLLTGIVQDISERKQAEKALMHSHDLLSYIIEHNQSAVAVHDRDLNYIYVSASYLDQHNVQERDVIGKHPYEVFPDLPQKWKDVHQKALAGEISSADKDPYPREDGAVDWTRWECRPWYEADGSIGGIIVYTENITEKMKAEAEKLKLESHLRQQQKLESIGTLASGVAHEINNPITGIMNYAQLISERLDPDQKQLKEFSENVIVESNRVAEIVRNLLTFSRDEKQDHSPARITDIVEQTISLIRTIIKRDQIELNVDIPDNLPDVKCRSQQIQQVLMNLLTNARDALNLRYPEYNADKIISVKVRQFEKDGRRWLRTTIEDHGGGIPPEIKERIFDPFFTTKDRALGTGLGLSISLGIVKDHHGELTFKSVENEYTRFYLDLPVDNGWEIE